MNLRVWFVDTGYWLAWLNSGDNLHARARAIGAQLGARRGARLVTTEAVLLEVGNATARPPLRALAVAFFRRILGNPNVEIIAIDRPLLLQALDLFAARPDKAWSVTDCMSFVVMQERGITDALAADYHFVQAGFRGCVRFL